MKPRKSGFLFLVLMASAVVSGAAPFVENGVKTESGEYAQVVKLAIRQGTAEKICSGTIIGRNTVLTAAHCLNKVDLSELTVTIPGKGDYPVTQVLLNANRDEDAAVQADSDFASAGRSESSPPFLLRDILLRWLDMYRYDVGLLKVPLPDSVNPIPVKRYDDASSLVGLTITIVGYGVNDSTAWIFKGVGTEREGTNQVAAAWNGFLFTVGLARDRVYEYGGWKTRADGKNVSSGHGDSGGAVLSKEGVVGVVSAGLGYPSDKFLEPLRQLLGADGDRLYQKKDGNSVFSMFVSLSSPASRELFESAKKNGFDVAFAR